MPLDGDDGRFADGRRVGLDKSVRRGRFGGEAVREAADTLIVNGVHIERRFFICAREDAAGNEIDAVAMIEHGVEGNAVRRVVADEIIARRGVAPQRAAECDVDLLKTAADAEHGAPAPDHRVHHRQRDLIAAGIERAFPAFVGIAAAFDVGRAAGEQHAVETRGDLGGDHEVRQRRDEQRGDIGIAHRRANIALYDGLRGLGADGTLTADDTKNGTGSDHT